MGLKEDGGILDEVQRLPVLLSYIQGMVDKTKKRGRFILTGSHQPQLHEPISFLTTAPYGRFKPRISLTL